LEQPNWVWTSVCTANRSAWLAHEMMHRMLQETWAKANHWLVADYIIMPDHTHFFAAPYEIEYDFDQWVSYWTGQLSRLHRNPDWRWQSHPFHRRLRHGESYTAKWNYLRENPVRKGLVKSSDEWPFQGRIFDIIWQGD
jgi:putative transposase